MNYFNRSNTIKTNKPILLTKDNDIIIQADDPKHNRGLIIRLVGEGGYDIGYWYDHPNKIYPAEIRVDGKTVSTEGKIVHIGYHPELRDIWKKVTYFDKTKVMTGAVALGVLFMLTK